MTERPKTNRRILGGATAPAWIGAAIIAAGGVFGSWLSFHSGAELAADRLTKLEKRVDVLEDRERTAAILIGQLTEAKHTHGRRQ